jgi:putative N6-adenine-specific DNA methylase
MCGSGTIAIEAALLAGRRAPGLGRRFAFEDWPGHHAAGTAAVRERFAAPGRTPPTAILASDRNGGAVRLATKNAEAAGVAPFVRIERRDAGDLEPPEGPGFCLVNPPYGVRLDREVEASWRALGALLVKLEGWTVGVVAGNPAMAGLLPGHPGRATDVHNGGIRCRFLVYNT